MRTIEDVLDEMIGANYMVTQAQIKEIREIHAAELAIDTNDGDNISRQAAIDALDCINGTEEVLRSLPSAQPSQDKYEYHYDHTDCIWYRPEARNRCPVTCAQYRDGWNDAMNYIFRDGEGYRPFRRDKKYEG